MDRPKVAIIILNWNRKDDTLACLRSLDRVAYEEREILVVDNHSTDGSVDAFRENYPGIEIIENDKNLGYAAGNNVGIRRAMENAADVILLLNNDTEVEPGFLGAMVDVLESDAHIGAVGPKIYYFSEPGVLWATGDMEGLGQRDVGQFNSVREVRWIVGCAFLMKIDVVKKIGLLDEDLFLYGEEDEYCTRMARAGFKMYYVPGSVVRHKVPYRPEGDHTKPYQVYYISRNAVIIRRKKFKTLRFCISLAKYLSLDVPRSILKYVRVRRVDLIRPALKGVFDGLLWCTGLKKAGENTDIIKTTRPSS